MARKRQPIIQLRLWRLRQGFTQQQLADATGLTISNISKLEHGHYGPQARTVRAIAEALGIEPHELYTPPADMVEAMQAADKIKPA